MSIKVLWKSKYETVPTTLKKLQELKGVLSVFNANIDAVRYVSVEKFKHWIEKSATPIDVIESAEMGNITSPASFFKGLLHCFEKGIAQEWLISDKDIYAWLMDTIGYDVLQMGGQGGIIANVLSLCEIEKVLVHAASLPKKQSGLFLNRENLLSANEAGELARAHSIQRSEDTPLIHWILEFKKGDTLTLGGKTYECPKSNRFIATWDPLNFRLAICENFTKAINTYEGPLDYCLLAGYQMLTEKLKSNETSLSRIQESKKIVQQWRDKHSLFVHFEFASTQDIVVRKQLLDEMGSWADSIGLNEQELIDLLEVIGEIDLAQECRENTHAVPLMKGLLALMKKVGIKRIQLHLFGLYITILQNTNSEVVQKNRDGMMLAATVAASKAGQGSLETEDSLLWAQGSYIGDVSEQELIKLARYLHATYGVSNFEETGIAITDQFAIVAVPTIIVENPISLVGMGDTISSLSLVGAH